MPEPVVAVVVNWNSGDDLLRCLECLAAQTLAPVEIVVVDNASNDGSLERARRRFPAVRYLCLEDNRGYAGGANAGLALARGRAALVLNPDCFLDPDFLRHAVPHLDEPGVGFVAGKIRRAEGDRLDSCGQTLSPLLRKVVERGYGEPDTGRYERCEPVPSVCGAAALYGSRLLARLAPDGALFDEDYFAFWEDADVGARARRAGLHGIYEPRAVARHRRGGTAAGSGRLLGRAFQILRRDEAVQYHILKNRWLFLLKNEPLGGLLLRAPFFLLADGALLVGLAVLRPRLFRRLLACAPLLRRAWRRRGSLPGALSPPRSSPGL